jgi:hypothetical protein
MGHSPAMNELKLTGWPDLPGPIEMSEDEAWQQVRHAIHYVCYGRATSEVPANAPSSIRPSRECSIVRNAKGLQVRPQPDGL